MEIHVNLLIIFTKQSPDIAQGVNEGEGEDLNQGAGDQGLMFGYACNETDSLMPAPIDLSHKLVKKQSEVRKSGLLEWLRPDAKSQVSVVYDQERKALKDYLQLFFQLSMMKMCHIKKLKMVYLIMSFHQ